MTIDAMDEFGITFEFDNTTVSMPSAMIRLSKRDGSTKSRSNGNTGPSPCHHARKGPSAIRAYTSRISAGIQGHVEGPRNSKGHRERQRVRAS